MKPEVRNVTFSFPVELLKRARIRAAERDVSLNELVKQAVEATLDDGERQRQQEAMMRLIERSKKGLYRMPEGGIRREDIYDRDVLR